MSTALKNKYGLFVFGLFLSLFALVVMPQQASAVNGAQSNVFPDTSFPAGSTTYAVVQLRSGGAQVRARSTVANVYVPVSLAGQQISLAVVNGCNNSGPDINGWIANTSFYIDYPYIPASARNTASHCSAGTINMQFIAQTTHSDGRPVRQVRDATGSYYVYRFKADAYGSENTQYLNAFQVWGVNAGLFIGPSDTPSDCDVAVYPRSCPSPRRASPYNGISIVYSSYYNRTSPSYGQQLRVRTGNCSNIGRISLYDLDANDTGLRQNLRMELYQDGALIGAYTHNDIAGWELYQNPPGTFPHLGIFGGNEDQYLDLPAVGTFSMLANTTYELRITGLSPNNAMQAAILTYAEGLCDDPGPGPGPGPIAGCTDPSATNYNPSATIDDGSCVFPDVCPNIPDRQLRVPDGYVLDGTNCVFPTPTCTPGPAQSGFVNDTLRLSARLRNNSSVQLSGVSASYNDNNGLSGTVFGGQVVGPTPSEREATATVSSTTPRTGNVVWTFSYDVPAPLGGRASVTCEQVYGISYRPPECSVVGIVDPSDPEVGERFRVRVNVRNPNAGAIQLTRAQYELQGLTNGANLSGNSEPGTIPQTLGAFSTVTLQSAQNIVVNTSTFDINIVWLVTADSGSVTCELPDDDSIRPDIPLLPPICTISPRTAVVGVPFIASVSVRNPNRFAPLRLLDGPVEYRTQEGQSGQAEPVGGWSGGAFVMGAGGQVAVETVPPGITLGRAGDHSISWSINSEAGLAGGDCNARALNGQNPEPPTEDDDDDNDEGDDGEDDDGDGDTDTPIAFVSSNQPYVRFYGNDVFSGGSYGETCSISSSPDARAHGIFSGTPSHATYRGSAAELAVFALGDINGVLPGAQDITRTSLGALSFANTSLAGGTSFGGSFANPLCADDYWAERGDTNLLPTDGDDTTGIDVVNINNLASGNYLHTGSLAITTNQTATADVDERLEPGTNITIYVDGDVWIGDSSYLPGRLRQIAYDTNAPWSSVDQIPLFRLIVRGNIYIDSEVSQLDGLYVAVPNSSRPDSGQIHTCASSNDLTNLRQPVLNVAGIQNNCSRSLLVNGAFIAKQVHLLRIQGNIGSAPSAPEAYDSGRSAEVFRFSPELYLALLAQGGRGAASATFDAIVSLPPTL